MPKRTPPPNKPSSFYNYLLQIAITSKDTLTQEALNIKEKYHDAPFWFLMGVSRIPYLDWLWNQIQIWETKIDKKHTSPNPYLTGKLTQDHLYWFTEDDRWLIDILLDIIQPRSLTIVPCSKTSLRTDMPVAALTKTCENIDSIIDRIMTNISNRVPLISPTFPDPILNASEWGPDHYQRVGLNILEVFLKTKLQKGLLHKPTAILDYACGCGRTARWFNPLWDNTSVIGIDPNKQYRELYNKNGGIFYSNAFSNLKVSFDNIIIISLFTHLQKTDIIKTLNKLTPKLSPTGFIMFTIAGEHTSKKYKVQLQKWADKQNASMPSNKKSNISMKDHPHYTAIMDFEHMDYGFVPYQSSTSNFGLTFMSRDVVVALVNQTKKLILTDYIPGGLDEYQDICIAEIR